MGANVPDSTPYAVVGILSFSQVFLLLYIIQNIFVIVVFKYLK
jgi:hypothetical protein